MIDARFHHLNDSTDIPSITARGTSRLCTIISGGSNACHDV